MALANWRNIDSLKMKFARRNYIRGQNGQGKTSILEAIKYATLLKGRATRDAELIQRDKDIAQIRLRYEKTGVRHELAIELRREEGRRILLDGMDLRPRELIGRLNTVLFTPDDLFMLKGAPVLRRKFLDAQIAQSSAEYFDALLRYNRLVQIRNELLKKIREGSAQISELDLWATKLFIKI